MRASRQRLVTCGIGGVLLAVASGCHRNNPDEHLRKADEYLSHSELSEAIVELRLAEQADDKRGDIREKLADAYMKVPDVGGAYREYIRAADLLPNDVTAQLAAGRILLAALKFEDAESRGKKALALDPKNVDAQILIGNAKAGLKDFDGALAEYQDALALDPSKDAAYANTGVIQLAQGHRADAEASFRKAVDAAPKSVPARLALANFLWSSGRAPEAEASLKEALALDPSNLTTNSALGMFYMASNRAKDAEPFYQTIANTAKTSQASIALADYYAYTKRIPDARKVLTELAAKKNEGYASATTRLAALDAAEGQRAQAETRLRNLLNEKPKEMPARLLLARLYVIDGKRDDAMKEATSIVTDEPTSPSAGPAYLVVGGLQASADRTEDAIAAYTEALKHDSRPVAAHAGLAAVYLKTGVYDQAAAHAQAALALQPNNPALRALQVRVLLTQNKTAEAKEQIAALQKQFPNAAPVLDLLAAQQLEEHQTEAARASYAKAAQLAPNDLEALAGLVRIDAATGHSKEALARVEAGLKTGPSSGDFLMVAGRTYATVGDMPKAEEMLRKAIEVQPDRLEAYGLLGSLYVAEHKLDDAADQFRTISAKNPKSVPAATMLGMIFEAQKKVPEAEKEYQAVLAIDSHAPVAANNLAWIYVSSNRNLDQALQLAQTAAQKLPDEPHVNDTLGWVYYHKNMTAEAVRCLENSVQKDPSDPATHYHLGMAYVQAGQLKDAKTELRHALALAATFADADEAKRTLHQLGG